MKRPKGIKPMIPAKPKRLKGSRPKGKPKRKRPGQPTVLALRGSPSWAAWLRSLAFTQGRPISNVVELALIQWAKDNDFRPIMPERLERAGDRI